MFIILNLALVCCNPFSRVPYASGTSLESTNDGYSLTCILIDQGEGITKLGYLISNDTNEVEILSSQNPSVGQAYSIELTDVILNDKQYAAIPFSEDINGRTYGDTFLFSFTGDNLYTKFEANILPLAIDSVQVILDMTGSKHTATTDRGLDIYYRGSPSSNAKIRFSLGEVYQPTYTIELGSLYPDVFYTCKPFFELEDGTFLYGDSTNFKIDIPAVTTGSVINKPQNNQATLNGEVTLNPDYLDIHEVGHCWSISSITPGLNDNKVPFSGTAPVMNYSTMLSNITPGITYYYRAYLLYESNRVVYGQVKTFMQ